MIIPSLAGVALVDFRDRIELTPFSWCREFIGLGRQKANEVGPELGSKFRPLYDAIMGDQEIWVVVCWRRFEDGEEEVVRQQCLDPDATETEAKEAFQNAVQFQKKSKGELEDLLECFEATDDDILYVESRVAEGERRAPDPRLTDEHDVYQARLKVLAGMQPKTVELIQRADETADPQERKKSSMRLSKPTLLIWLIRGLRIWYWSGSGRIQLEPNGCFISRMYAGPRKRRSIQLIKNSR